jgi:hypothetical protein
MTAKELEEKHGLVISIPEACGEITSVITDSSGLFVVTDTATVIELKYDPFTGKFVGYIL